METFDLDKEMHKWLRSFRRYRPFNHGSIRELELHMRDYIDDLVGQGLSVKEAFEKARKDFGEPDAVAREENWNIQKRRNINSIINNTMISSYIKVAIRHFGKHKFHSILNLAGLTTGLAIVFLIALFVTDELSFDNHFSKKDHLYRVVENQYYSGQPVFPVAVTPTALSPALSDQFPEVIKSARVSQQDMQIRVDDVVFNERGGLMVDADFLDMFDVEILAGDITGFREDVRAVVLSEELAKKYFPDGDAVGKPLNLDDEEFMVRAIMADQKANTHMPFKYLFNFEYYLSFDPSRSESWGSNWLYTYVEVDPNSDATALNDKITSLIKENQENSATEIYLQPLTDIYLGEVDFVVEAPEKGEMLYVKIFILVALFILLISCINFMNLATAKSENRAKEVGLRKTVGANRPELMLQFLSESVFMAFIAVLLAIGVVTLLLPYFNEITGKQIELATLWNLEWGFKLLLIISGAALTTGLLAGFYPAVILSKARPALTLKNNGQSVQSAGWFRKALVITQFTISVVLIIGTLVVVEQVRFIQQVDLGYDKHNLAYINVPLDKAANFANELRNETEVLAAGLTNIHPGYVMNSTSGYNWQGKNPDENILIHQFGVDEHYMSAMNMRLVDGRGFTRNDSLGVIINERAAEIMGFDDPVGQTIESGDDKLTIIGVVANFNFKSIHTAIEPLLIYLASDPGRVFIRYKPGNEERIREIAESTWTSNFPDLVFQLYYLDDDWSDMYQAEERTARLSTFFAAIAIIVSCLGLFGLVSYTAEKRTREIGIRKVLGASVPRIFVMLATDFTRLILASLILSIPIGWYLMNRWLEGYAYHIEMSWVTVAFTVVGVLLITLGTISYQSIKISMTNPVNVLKSE